MARKTIIDEVYGKITYKEGCWSAAEKKEMIVGGKKQEFKIEIESVSSTYDKIQLGLLKKEVAEILLKSKAINEDTILENKKIQCGLYKNLLVDNIKKIEKNIENAAIYELAEVLQDYDETSLSKVIGKEKAAKLFHANTIDEKLESLQLLEAHVFVDRIEIKCKCDWYKYGGGFIIIESGECMMRPTDCLSI